MTDHPACCTSPEPLDCFAAQYPDLRLLTCRFDPARVSFAQDAATLDLAPPEGLWRAVPKRQAEYLAGRLCAREAVRRLTGTAVAPGHRATDRGPAWPSGCVGAITHSQGWAAAAAGHASAFLGVGLDVESLLTAERAERLADQILTPAEIERLTTASSTQRAFTITLAFSAKESLFKALHPQVQRMFFFHDAEVIDLDLATGTFTVRLLLDLSARWQQGAEITGLFCAQPDAQLLTLVAPRA